MRLDEESGTATEDEEDVRARELRKQEVWLKVPPRSSDTDTGSETEVKKPQDNQLESDGIVNDLDVNLRATHNTTMNSNPETDRSSALKTNEKLNLEEAKLDSKRGSDSSSHLEYVDLDSSTLESISSNGEPRNDPHDPIPGDLEPVGLKIDLDHQDRPEVRLNHQGDPEADVNRQVDLEFDHDVNGNAFQLSKPDQVSLKSDNLPDLITSSPKFERHAQESRNATDLNGKSELSNIPVISIFPPTSEDPEKLQGAFGNLKQELKLRRARKKEGLAELRPLSRETARSKVNEYFRAMQNSIDPGKTGQDMKNQLDNATCEQDPEIPVIPLDAKSQMSDKVESKDLLKYFEVKHPPLLPPQAIYARETKRQSCPNPLFESQNIKDDLTDFRKSSEEIEVLREAAVSKDKQKESQSLSRKGESLMALKIIDKIHPSEPENSATENLTDESNLQTEKPNDFITSEKETFSVPKNSTKHATINDPITETKISTHGENANPTLITPEPIEKITVIAKEIIPPSPTIPKRPERKRHDPPLPEIVKPSVSPEIPRRRKPESRALEKPRETHDIESLKIDQVINSENKLKPDSINSKKLSNESKKLSNPLKSLTLRKTDDHGSSKSVASSKFDKSNKKDKCVIS